MPFLIDNDGLIYTEDMQVFGFFDVNGDVYDKDAIAPFSQLVAPPVGLPIGFVDIAGDVYNAAHAHIGFADSDGTLYNMGILQSATLNDRGELRDLRGTLLANVRPGIHGRVHKPEWCPMPFRASAALFFILLDRQ